MGFGQCRYIDSDKDSNGVMSSGSSRRGQRDKEGQLDQCCAPSCRALGEHVLKRCGKKFKALNSDPEEPIVINQQCYVQTSSSNMSS